MAGTWPSASPSNELRRLSGVGEDLARIQDVLRVQRAFEQAHQLDLRLRAGDREVVALLEADAMLRRDGATDRPQRFVDVLVRLPMQRIAVAVRRWVHEQVEVAVARVAHDVAPAVRPAPAEASLHLLDVA